LVYLKYVCLLIHNRGPYECLVCPGLTSLRALGTFFDHCQRPSHAESLEMLSLEKLRELEDKVRAHGIRSFEEFRTESIDQSQRVKMPKDFAEVDSNLRVGEGLACALCKAVFRDAKMATYHFNSRGHLEKWEAIWPRVMASKTEIENRRYPQPNTRKMVQRCLLCDATLSSNEARDHFKRAKHILILLKSAEEG
jgi:uncharacterized C2H2 Zn-finger protein